jgi:hypothetical protein
MDSLSVGIRVPSIDCDGETWTRVNTGPRNDLFFPDALFLPDGGWPGSDWNGGRHQIGTVAGIRSEYLAALRWNSQLEANYDIHVMRGVHFQPDVQYVIQPNAQANIHNAVVLGFRARVSF